MSIWKIIVWNKNLANCKPQYDYIYTIIGIHIEMLEMENIKVTCVNFYASVYWDNVCLTQVFQTLILCVIVFPIYIYNENFLGCHLIFIGFRVSWIATCSAMTYIYAA